MTTRILRGHVLDRLAELPDESVHCCVSSPPYFGLRSYGTEPQVWDGELNCGPQCQWGHECIAKSGRNDSGASPSSGVGFHGQAEGYGGDRTASQGAFCLHCNAWRGSLGLEPSPELYIAHLVDVFREVRRVLRKDGTLWLNIGDSYNGQKNGNTEVRKNPKAVTSTFVKPLWSGCRKPKDLLGIPWMLAFALRADGWWLRSEIIWAKKAPMPESVTDRPTSATEKVFLLTRSPRYFYDAVAVQEEAVRGDANAGSRNYRPSEDAGRVEDGQAIDNSRTSRNMRNWWLLGPEPFPEAHFAAFPTEIPRICIKAGTSERGVCPKCGAPWERVTKTTNATRRGVGSGSAAARISGGLAVLCATHAGAAEAETIGWRPTCSCNAEPPTPATALDPFLGAGTTALVADQLGRDCIGIELNQSYAKMAERRLRNDAGMFAQVGE